MLVSEAVPVLTGLSEDFLIEPTSVLLGNLVPALLLLDLNDALLLIYHERRHGLFNSVGVQRGFSLQHGRSGLTNLRLAVTCSLSFNLSLDCGLSDLFAGQRGPLVGFSLFSQLVCISGLVISCQLVPLHSLFRRDLFELLRYSTHYLSLFYIWILLPEFALFGNIVEEVSINGLLNFRVYCVL